MIRMPAAVVRPFGLGLVVIVFAERQVKTCLA
jgi:hypothetical protein